MSGAVLAYLPSPSRSVLHLGPLPIRAYALCIFAGIVLALAIAGRRWRARGGNPDHLWDICGWAVVFGIIGGRLYHVVSDPELYFKRGGHPLNAFKIWDGGLGIWGAVALGGVGAWIGCAWTGAGGAAARAWVFARPVDASSADEIVRAAGRQADCSAEPTPVFGAPALLQNCKLAGGLVRARRAGLFGDTWLTCEVTAPAATPEKQRTSTLDSWCATVVAALP